MKTFRKKLLGKASAKETFRESFIKAQSAMEYLMTYGWAILIISVVLAALFQLGVFNPMTFAPKAPPGSCQVFRPNGPYTTSFINLEGICSGELPQYVASFSQSPAGYIYAPTISESNAHVTISFWLDPINNGYWGNSGNYWEGAVTLGLPGVTPCSGSSASTFIIESGHLPPPQESWSTVSCSGNRDFPEVTLSPNTWQQLVGVFNGSYLTVYLNGKLIGSPVSNNAVATYNTVLISGTQSVTSGAGDNPISGYMANLQIYNTSLSANEIQALYQEGIGGAPIDLQNLVGWWPLNGNANDYSGNGNNGQAYNVNFVSNWYSDYTPP